MVARKVSNLGELSAAEKQVIAGLDTGELIVLGDGSGRERDRRATELRRIAWWRRPAHWGFTQLLRMVGYGYRPAWALAPALAVVLLGWGAVERAAEAGVLVPARAAVAGTPEVALAPLAYSFEAFVPIVKLGQAEAFRPDMAQPWGYGLQVYLWLHGFAGWLIGGIAAAGVLGLFRRD